MWINFVSQKKVTKVVFFLLKAFSLATIHGNAMQMSRVPESSLIWSNGAIILTSWKHVESQNTVAMRTYFELARFALFFFFSPAPEPLQLH